MPVIRDGKAILVGPDGGLVQVDPSEAQKHVASGVFVDATEQMVSAADQAAKEQARQAELQTPGAVANTALQTASRAITAPIDWAASKLGAQQGIANLGQTPEEAARTNAQIREMQQLNPGATFVGEVGGQLAAAAATGLTSGAAKLAGGITKSALGRVAIASGIEGAALGASAEMEDPNASAQHVLAAGGMGLLLGAGGGAALHGAGAGLRRIFGRSDNELVNAAVDATAEQQAAKQSTLESVFGKAAREGSNAPEELLREVGPGGTRMREAMQAADHHEVYVRNTASKIADIANETLPAVDEAVQMVRSSSMKEEALRKLIDPTTDSAARRATADNLLSAAHAKFVEDVLLPFEQLGTAEGVSLPAATRNQIARMERHFEQAISGTSVEDDLSSRFMKANQLKQGLDELKMKLSSDAGGGNTRYTPSEKSIVAEAATKVREFTDVLRSSLEDPKIFGAKAAAAQRDINSIWHHGGVDSVKEMQSELQRQMVSKDFETGMRKFEADAGSIERLISDPTSNQNRTALRAMDGYLDKMTSLVETIGEKYEVTTQQHRALEKLTEMKSLFAEAKDRAVLAQKWHELETYKATGKTALVSSAVGAVPFMGRAADAIAAAATPAKTARFLDAISAKAADTNKVSMFDSVGSWIRNGGTTTGKALERAAGSPVLTSAAVNVFRGNHKSDQVAMDARLRSLYKADPANLGEHIQGVADPVMFHAGTVASTAISYLRSQVPAYLTQPNLLQASRKMVMSLPDQIKFGRIWGTVADPSTAVKDLKTGRLMPSQVAALQAVYPAVYDELRTQTLVALGAADAAGKQIPIQVRAQLSLLLQLDGANEPAMSDAFSAKVRDLIAANAQGQKPKTNQNPPVSSKLAAARRSPFEEAIEA